MRYVMNGNSPPVSELCVVQSSNKALQYFLKELNKLVYLLFFNSPRKKNTKALLKCKNYSRLTCGQTKLLCFIFISLGTVLSICSCTGNHLATIIENKRTNTEIAFKVNIKECAKKRLPFHFIRMPVPQFLFIQFQCATRYQITKIF